MCRSVATLYIYHCITTYNVQLCVRYIYIYIRDTHVYTLLCVCVKRRERERERRERRGVMGNQQSFGGGDKKRGGSDKDKDGKQKKKWEPPAPATRVGKRQRRMKGAGEGSERLPAITPASQCKLRLLKLERVKDYLLMEEEFVTNQERLRPAEEKNEEETSKVKKLSYS